ncbi:phage major capsid protein [Salipiger bermudensis]|uniref:phage major capsid protein n=1 Tax=Salipiger bermudensis TaxID=344736 RepID=UPI001CD61B18|nr:phage major capsid protein [Salipiger bermudensis]MCA0963289.1 phage major capsid protein [Salipiger bermudensis]
MSGDKKTAEQLAAEMKAAHEKSINAVKEIAEEALGKAKSGEELTSKIKETADEALLKMNELTGQMTELEQKMARRGDGDQEERKSLGQRFVEDERVKAWLESGPSSGKADLRVKADLTTLTTDADGSVGDGAAPTRLPGVQEQAQRRMTVRDLLSQGRMDGNTIEYVQETGFNNNAAPVAEGSAKPSSDIQLDLKSSTAKVIAHWMKASRQALDDVSFLRSMIDQRLIYGLSYAEENQLLNGDGTGQNLSGLITNATAYSEPFAPAAATAIDTMRLAMLQAALAEYPATGHVMNPVDWARIELTKDSEGRYIIGNPQGTLSPTLWNLPVVATQAMGVDKFLTGAFKLGAQIFDRWDARVEAGYVNDDFTRNMVTLLAEERLALAVYRPEAFIYGDLGFVA